MTIKLITTIHGSSNSGKSLTLRYLCKLILKEENIKQIIFKKGNGVRAKEKIVSDIDFESPKIYDFAAVIHIETYNRDLIVGISTGGDNEKILNRNFDFFKEHECELIYCAATSTKKSINHFYNNLYLQSYKSALILPFYKYRAKEEYKEIFNKNLAQNILTATKLYWNNIDDNNFFQ